MLEVGILIGVPFEIYHPINESNDHLHFGEHSLDFCILILLECADLLLIEFSVQDSIHIALSLILQFMIDLEECHNCCPPAANKSLVDSKKIYESRCLVVMS